jgi:uncharacterized membrane protein YeaQ/YmgE (transglycosylase-associated protein family)
MQNRGVEGLDMRNAMKERQSNNNSICVGITATVLNGSLEKQLVKKEKKPMVTFAALVLGFALNPGGIIAWLIIGLLAGLIAGFLVKGSGFGIIGDIVVGLIGALIGGFIASALFGASFGFWWSLLFAIIGAVILLLIIRAFRGGSYGRRTI